MHHYHLKNNRILLLISIIIPNYNGSKTIPLTLGSLEEQTLNDFEVIIVDDGSRDDSVSLIHHMIDGKENYTIIEQAQNQGAAAARNAGVKMAKGKILMFIDSDIIINKDTIKKISNFFKIHDAADAVVGLPDSRNRFSNWPRTF